MASRNPEDIFTYLKYPKEPYTGFRIFHQSGLMTCFFRHSVKIIIFSTFEGICFRHYADITAPNKPLEALRFPSGIRLTSSIIKLELRTAIQSKINIC